MPYFLSKTKVLWSCRMCSCFLRVSGAEVTCSLQLTRRGSESTCTHTGPCTRTRPCTHAHTHTQCGKVEDLGKGCTVFFVLFFDVLSGLEIFQNKTLSSVIRFRIRRAHRDRRAPARLSRPAASTLSSTRGMRPCPDRGQWAGMATSCPG